MRQEYITVELGIESAEGLLNEQFVKGYEFVSTIATTKGTVAVFRSRKGYLTSEEKAALKADMPLPPSRV